MIFALPFFVLSAWWSSSRSDNVKFTWKQWFAVALIGCVGYYISSLLDFLGLQYVSAGIERLILFVYPTVVLILSAVFVKIKIKPVQWLAVAVTYLGLIIAFWGEINFEGHGPKFYTGALLIFACAITYALYIVGSGRLIPIIGAAKFNSYAMTFAAVAVVIHFMVVSNQSLLNLSGDVYMYSFMMAIVSTVIPSYLVAEGIRRVGSNNAAVIGSIGPVSTIVQAYFFLQEPIHALQLAGTALVLGGILMITRK
jgi:drug/metabolite transporter (DMT)-like permease